MATLVALPVLFFGRGSVDIDASSATAGLGVVAPIDETATTGVVDDEATASSLLDTVDRNGLLDGGADPTAALLLQRQDELDPSTTVVVPPVMAPTNGSSTTVGGNAGLPAAERSLSATTQDSTSQNDTSQDSAQSISEATTTSAQPRSTSTPTTAAPTSPAPTTAAPTTAAPTTAAPTTAVPTTAAPTTAAPTTATPAADPSDDGGLPSAEDWAALRECEAFGSYTIVSANGLYHGAYQFSIATWNAAAAAAGRPDLVDVLPSEASPADQDALALNLWTRRGFAPWPHCGQGLG